MARPLGRLLTAMVTPFDAAGDLDRGMAARLAQALVASGSDGVVVNGTTGESPTLTAEERLALLDVVRAALPEHTVVMGTGTYDTRTTVALTTEAKARGADAALVVAPYYNRPPQEGLRAHFERVADVGLPVVVYNIPSRCGVNVAVETQLRLAEHPAIVGVKEASGDVEQVARICGAAPSSYLVWSGDDATTLPFLAVGAYGVVSVASHVAGRAMRQLLDAFLAGDVVGAARLHQRLLPLFKGLFVTTNPIPVKAALQHLGLDCGGLRLPLVDLDAQRRAELGRLLDSLGDLVGIADVGPVGTTTPAR